MLEVMDHSGRTTTTDSPARSEHPYHMHDAIYAQPGALRLLGRGNAEALEAATISLRACHHLILCGTGSSRHAALVAERLFATAGGFGHRARVQRAFELAGAWPTQDASTGLVLVTHRAASPAEHDLLARAKATGATTVVVTSRDVASVAHADHLLRTVAAEASQALTVGYTCAVGMRAMLAAAIGSDDDLQRALDGIPDPLALLLGQESWEEMAARFADRRRYFFVGGGPEAATALEAALKASETGHLIASGFDTEDFLHGAWVALEETDLLAHRAPRTRLPAKPHRRARGARSRRTRAGPGRRRRSRAGRGGRGDHRDPRNRRSTGADLDGRPPPVARISLGGAPRGQSRFPASGGARLRARSRSPDPLILARRQANRSNVAGASREPLPGGLPGHALAGVVPRCRMAMPGGPLPGGQGHRRQPLM